MNKQTFTIAKSMYAPQVILKAAYAFIGDVYIHFDETPDNWVVHYSLKNDTYSGSTFIGEFENELIAQAVRWNVYHQTHAIRELLMARAMTSTMIDDNDSLKSFMDAQSDIDSKELEAILTNWFDCYEKKN